MYLGLYLPRLPLELLAPTTRPLAIHEKQRVLLANAPAMQHGIGPGMDIDHAYVLCAQLIILEYDASQVQSALERLANICLQFTSQVYIQDRGLVLEVGASLKLFNGLQGLMHAIENNLRQLQHEYRYSVAPTLLAAWWLAQNNTVKWVGPDHLRHRLAKLPVHIMGLPAGEIESLHQAGLMTLGQCLGLPHGALRQRYGNTALLLQQAMGHIRHLSRAYQAPEFFQGKLMLGHEILDQQALLFPLQRLLRELCAYLAMSGQGINQFKVFFYYEKLGKSQLTIHTLRLSRYFKGLWPLLRERLEHHHLDAGVMAVELEARSLFPLAAEYEALFATRQETQDLQLIERLQARLGKDNVHGVEACTDHRPEYSSRNIPAGQTMPPALNPPGKLRPLWILKQPFPLGTTAYWRGPLQLLGNEERIEAGWWDGQGVQRDYYMARSKQNTLLWIFRDANGWFLHGFFA